MIKQLSLCAAMLAVAGLAYAQETPHYEFFVGGSYVFEHGNGSELTKLFNFSGVQFQQHNLNFQQLGWEATLVENANRWLGGEFDFGGFYGTPSAGFLYPASELVSPNPDFSKKVPIILRQQSILFGPRLTWRRPGPLVLFAHMPIGIAYANASLSQSAVVATNFQVLPVGTIKSDSGLAISPGIGADLRLNGRMMVRVIQVDYLMTHVFATRQDNVRVSAGLNLTFGQK
jgi:hypothetical protein